MAKKASRVICSSRGWHARSVHLFSKEYKQFATDIPFITVHECRRRFRHDLNCLLLSLVKRKRKGRKVWMCFKNFENACVRVMARVEEEEEKKKRRKKEKKKEEEEEGRRGGCCSLAMEQSVWQVWWQPRYRWAGLIGPHRPISLLVRNAARPFPSILSSFSTGRFPSFYYLAPSTHRHRIVIMQPALKA